MECVHTVKDDQLKESKEKQKGTRRTRRVSNDGGCSVKGERALRGPQSAPDGAAKASITTLIIVSSAKSKSPNSNQLQLRPSCLFSDHDPN